jgi:hypothetical protein
MGSILYVKLTKVEKGREEGMRGIRRALFSSAENSALGKRIIYLAFKSLTLDITLFANLAIA